MSWQRRISTVLCVIGATFAAVTCGGPAEVWDGDEVELCGPNPAGCDGTIGARCSVTDDCADGVCCRSGSCGGGTCTFLCGSHADCPGGMLCDEGFCFYACNSTAQCGPGQECREDETICQY